MSEVLVTPRRRVDWGQMGQYAAQPFAAQQGAYETLLPLLFKHQLEKQAKIEELNYTNRMAKDKFEHALSTYKKYSNNGDLKMTIDSEGKMTLSETSPTEKAAGRAFTEQQGLLRALPRFRKYGLHEATTQEPGIATERIAQLSGKLSSQYPSQMELIKGAIGTLTPPKIGGKQALNPEHLARGMAQMFKNTEAAFPETSNIPAVQRFKTGYGILPFLSTKTGIGTTPRRTGEIATQKIRARSFLKNFENNRFTDKDIEHAIAGMTNPTLTSGERLAIVVQTVTQAGAANGIPGNRIMPILARELGMTEDEISNKLGGYSQGSNARLKSKYGLD